jgi:GNAT superfamily N-acetyltransferase
MIRPATLDDAPAIARVHAQSWLETYQGIIPDEVLGSFNLEMRTQRWQTILSEPDPSQANGVLLQDGEVVGFFSAGPERDKDPLYTGELYAIYLLESHQGKGLGKQLFDASVEFLKQQGHTNMLLWALKGNKTIGFYEHMAGRRIYEKDIRVTPLMLPGVAYGWPELKELQA